MRYYLYKITNLINGNVYIGVHQTNIESDQYMGSGVCIRRAIKKYGKKNFKKEILKEFDNAEEMYAEEAILVNAEFVSIKNTYNIKLGGCGGFDHLNGTVSVKDSHGITFRVSKSDPRYISGELKSWACGMVVVSDKNGNNSYVSTSDPRYMSGELQAFTRGTVSVKDASGNTLRVSSDDPRYESGELVHVCHGKISVRDAVGNTSQVSIDDSKYKSGELTSVLIGSKKSSECLEKMSKKMRSIMLGNSNYMRNKIWISNADTKQNKLIVSGQIPIGWERGKNCWIKKSNKIANAVKKELDESRVREQYLTLYEIYKTNGFNSIRDFCKSQHCSVSQPTISRYWKRYLPNYNEIFSINCFVT